MTRVVTSAVAPATGIGRLAKVRLRPEEPVGCSSWPPERNLSPERFVQCARVASGRLFDLRTPTEIDKGAVPGASVLQLPEGGGSGNLGALYRHVAGPSVASQNDAGIHDESSASSAEPSSAKASPWPELPGLVRQLEAHRGGQLCLYCLSGGLRSQSVAAFLLHHGYNVCTLKGGYKAFKQWCDAEIMKPRKICIVGGASGSGKTEVLQELLRLGLQVVDLEALACHKGSVFGHLGERPQPTCEHFRNRIAMELASFDSSRFVFLEDEEARIGRLALPEGLYRQMRTAALVVQLDLSFALRAQRLLSVYGSHSLEALSAAVEKFRKHVGDERTDELKEMVAKGRLLEVCEAALRNYDRSYAHHLQNERVPGSIVPLPLASADPAQAAKALAAVAEARESEAAPSEAGAAFSQAVSSDSAGAGSVPVQEGVLPSASPAAIEVRSEPGGPSSAGGETVLPSTALCTEATCHCGMVTVRVRGDPLAVSICHCSICRRLSGAPFVASALFKAACAEVVLRPGVEVVQLVETRTSTHVARQRCGQCFTPVAAMLGSDRVAVPVGLFDWRGGSLPAAWQPQHHLHYGSRIMDIQDAVPKYLHRFRGPLCDNGGQPSGPGKSSLATATASEGTGAAG